MIWFIAIVLGIPLACIAAAYIVARTPPVSPGRPRVNRAPAFPLPNRRARRTRDSYSVAHPPTSKGRACGWWGRR